MSKPDPYLALRHKDYSRFLIGRLISNIGSQMQSVAVGWELYERTHSAMTLGLVGLVTVVPVLLFALPAGHWVDRFDRKRILMGAQLLFVLSSLGLAFLSITKGPIPAYYVCLFFVGVARSFASPSASAMMPSLLPISAFHNAVTWSSNGFQIASVAGPAFGGLIIGVQKAAWGVYLLEACTGIVYFFLLSAIKVRRETPRHGSMTLESLSAGIRFVWKTKTILSALTLDMFAVLLGGATALLPIYAKDILHVGPEGLGWLRAAPSAGAFLTGLIIAHSHPFRRAGKALLLSVGGFGLATIVFGLSPFFWLSFAALFFTGVCDNVSVVVRHTLVQVFTPDHMRGRVSAVNGVFISSSNEMGEFESGTVAAWLGPVMAVVLGGVGTIIVVLFSAWRWPELRNLGALHPPPETSSSIAAEEKMTSAP